MKTITVRDRLHYGFDILMSKGPLPLIGGLFLASVALVFIIAGIDTVLQLAPAGGEGTTGFLDLAWMNLMRTLDAGTMGGDEGSRPFLFSMFAVTVGGLFVVAILIGVLTSGIEQKLEELRKGRSFVAEQGHTVVLGWSPHIFTIISELVAANESRKRGACIAILADKDKVEMEDELAAKQRDTKNTRVVCRTGAPSDIADLDIVNIQAARSIIVLPPDGDEADSSVIKTLLAITRAPNRRSDPYHIVAVMNDDKNRDVAKMVGGDEVEIVLPGDLISRITVQTCRQSGLSVVLTELLDFGGDEIYFKEEPGLAGKSFGEALFTYETSSVMGVCTRDKQVKINPPMDTKIGAGDQLIVVAEDDDKIVIAPRTSGVEADAIRLRTKPSIVPEHALILGWNRRGTMILTELDQYVVPGSTVKVVASSTNAAADIDATLAVLKRQRVEFRQADTSDRRVLDELTADNYDHIIVLSYSDELATQAADSRTLVTLLHLRDIEDKSGRDFSVVTEMLDLRNRQLAEVTQADDFIVSDRLVSLLVSQLSENKHLARVFEELFDPEGSEIYLKPAEEYVSLGRTVSFDTVIEAARRLNEVALGYRIAAQGKDAEAQYGVHVNPRKSEQVTFSDCDKIIVIAES